MNAKPLSAMAACSMMGAVVVLIVGLISYQLAVCDLMNWNDDRAVMTFDFNSDFHVGLQDGDVYWFNGEAPYLGSGISFDPTDARFSGFSISGMTWPGIKYRKLWFPIGSFYGLRLSLAYPFALFMIPPLVWLIIRHRQRKRREGRFCTKCGYDLRGSSTSCPECGLPIPRTKAT